MNDRESAAIGTLIGKALGIFLRWLISITYFIILLWLIYDMDVTLHSIDKSLQRIEVIKIGE
jgi:hypothetical protein